MLKSTRLRLAGVVATVAALALGFLLRPDAELAPAPAVPSTADAPRAAASAVRSFTVRPSWSVGTRYVYTLEWRTEQRLLPPLPGREQGKVTPMDGARRLSGDLVLRALGRDGESFLLGASLENLREPMLRISSQPEPDAASLTAALTGHEALLEVDGAGNLRSLRFAPQDPSVFKHLLQELLTLVEPTLPVEEAQRSAGRWEVLESTSQGQVRSTYEVEADDSHAVHRGRSAYTRLYVVPSEMERASQQLESQARFAFAEAGHLSGVSHQERLVVRNQSGVLLLDSKELLRLSLRELGTFTPPADMGLAAHTEVRQPGVITASAQLERKLLQQRAGELTVEQLVADLLKYGASGNMPDKNRWVWRASGRLMLEPERCRELVPVFARPELGDEGRALLMDVLASAGNAQAQGVMRELLEMDVARGGNPQAYELLLQRLGMVEEPTTETLESLMQYHARARAEQRENVRNASAYALGAAGGNLAADDARAGGYTRMLVDELGTARSAGDRETYLRALGNAGREEGMAAVLAHAADPEEPVRATTAAALRKTDTPEATATLLRLARDSSRSVQSEAIVALRTHRLDAGALVALRDTVVSGGLHSGVEPLLVGLLAEQLEGGPAVAQTLRFLANAVQDDPSLHTRILELLARAESPARTH
ncbi:HEAT repeat domain-containing protein [Vitiosangium sp. GDMCC 1.1324]|uniref:HEAT repeat domain-containing protein n=1 Tax=Vitiosangium sp. (strain GDMCC 1.1324) TaxID=2138576 RepID=UPI000D391067|nr:HEAT repeat domain-containing protein [Vitiosangium sp. GDMCC 1.1324]PTL79153.1 hypothetical protein DAT35_36770 [Vitiosangium sp. GDMCC 1.1324]